MGEFDDLIPSNAPAKAGVGVFDDLVPVRDMTAPGFVFHQPPAPEPIDETAPYSERRLQEQQNVNRQVMANVLPPTPNELEASRPWGPLESIFKTGKILRAGLADIGTAPVKEPGEDTFRNVKSVYANKPVMPVDTEMANAGKAISYPYKAASGLIETAPQLAATMVAPEAGVPAWLAGGAAFGFDEQGNFKPVNAAIGALLPGFGKVVGDTAESIALKYGVSNETALTLIKAASATGAAGTVLGAQAAYEISKLPPEQRKAAAVDAVLGILGPSLLGLTEIVGERDHAKAQQTAMDNEAKLKALLNSGKFVIPGTENWLVPPPNAPLPTGPAAPAISGINATIRNQVAAAQPPEPPQPVNRIRVPRFDQPLQELNQNAPNPLVQQEGGRSEHPGVAPGQNLQPNAPEVRKETGTEAGGGNRPVGTTPQPNAPEAAVANLPPVKPGFVRLYHGGIKPEEARDVTPNYAYAKGYADKGGTQSRVWYVDVPEDAPWLRKAYDDTGLPQKSPPAHQTAPVEVMTQAKEVPKIPLNPGGAQSDLPPDQQAISKANNSQEAFEALAKAKGITLPTPVQPEPVKAESVQTSFLTDETAATGSRYITAKIDGQPWEIRVSDHSQRGAGRQTGVYPATSRARRNALMEGDTQGREVPFNGEIITPNPSALSQQDIAAIIKKHTNPEFYEEESNILNVSPEQVKSSLSKPVVDQPVNNPETAAAIPETVPAPVPKTQPEIIRDAARLKVKSPEGATQIRITTPEGKTAVLPIAQINKGDNPFRGVEASKIESGTIGKDKKFVPVNGDVTVTDASKPRQAQFPGEIADETRTVRPTTSVGLDQIREALSDPRLGYDPRTVKVALDILKQPVFKKMDWSNLVLAIRQKLEGNAKGAAWIADNLIEMSGAADPLTFPHELFHFLYENLPPAYKDAINQFRLDELRKIYGDNIPEALRTGTMTSDAFQRSGMPGEQYHLSTPSEFLAEFSSNRFNDKSWANRNEPEGFWTQFKSDMKAWIRGIINAIKRTFRVRPTMNRIDDELLSGVWKGTPETGRAFEERQAQLPKSEEGYEKQQALQERATPERTMAGYGDLLSMKERAAVAIGANEEAQKTVRIPRWQDLTEAASHDLGVQRMTLGNYDAMMQRVGNSDPGLRWSVTKDALEGLAYEQRRVLRTKAAFDAAEVAVSAPGFVKKLGRLALKSVQAMDAENARDTFNNQITQQAGDVLRMLDEKGKTEAEYNTLRQTLKRLEAMKGFNEAVTQRVNDIVDTVSQTEGGLNLLFQGGDKTGTEIARAYIDLKETAANTFKNPTIYAGREEGFDRQYREESSEGLKTNARYLTEAERQRANSNLPPLTADDKAFIHLASQVLAANTDLRLRMVTAAHYLHDPVFKANVNAVGERFQKQYEADPNNAIKQIVKQAGRLAEKSEDAEAAYLRLNKEVLPQLQEYERLRQATEIDRRVQASPEWTQLVNRIYADASKPGKEAIRVPDSEIDKVTSGTVQNEFNGKQILRSPQGNEHEIDLGFTKASADKAQADLQSYLSEIRQWLDDPANANSVDRRYWQDRHDFAENVLNVSNALRPHATTPLGIKHPWTIPEFLFKQVQLPQVKLAFQALGNVNRGWNIANQWFNQKADLIVRAVIQGMKSHGLDVNDQLLEYRRRVLTPLAWEYANGRALKAGDRLKNGTVLTQSDIAALKQQGGDILGLFEAKKNLGREGVMSGGLSVDEWAHNVYALHAPQELGAERGTTLPREFSTLSRALATRVAAVKPGDLAGVRRVLDSENNFNDYVKDWISYRKSAYTKLSPFEALYRNLTAMWEANDPASPKSIQAVIDYLDSNTSGYSKAEIEKSFVGDMEAQLRKFHKNFVDSGLPTDLRVIRASKDTSFTKSRQEDVGGPFFYDYGVATKPEIRAFSMDSIIYDLTRFSRAMDAALQSYDAALAELQNAADPKAAKKTGMKAYHAGTDFRDWENLMEHRNWLQKFNSHVVDTLIGRGATESELFGGVNQSVGMAVAAKMTGLPSAAHIIYGSITKTAMNLAAFERFYLWSTAKAAWSTAMSAVAIPARVAVSTVKAIRQASRAGYKVTFQQAVQAGLSDVTESLYKQAHYFRQQYDYGLGFGDPIYAKIENMINAPYSGGRLSENPKDIGLVRKGFYRAFSLAPGPILETIKAYFPQLGFVVSYDAAARSAMWTLKSFQAQALRSFDYLEKTGKLADYDFNNVKSVKNLDRITGDMLVGRGLFKANQTNLNFAQDWFNRSIDLPVKEMMLNYWKRLAATPKDQRGTVSFFGSDQDDPLVAARKTEVRVGSLLGTFLEDVHHASLESRPWELKTNSTLRAIMPMMGWASQSMRQWFHLMGRASSDPVYGPGSLKAMAYVTALLPFLVASVFVGGEGEKKVMGWISKFLYHEDTAVKTLGEARNAKEAVQILASDVTTYNAVLNSVVNGIMGEKTHRAGMGLSSLMLEEVNTVVGYLNGVVHTGNPFYGLANLSKSVLPLSKTIINQLDSQQGLIKERNLVTLAQKFGPEELVEKGMSRPGGFTPNELTPFRTHMANALYAGNMDQLGQYYQDFINQAESMGKTPAQAQTMAQQALTSLNFYNRAFGQKLTAQQRQEFLDQLSPEMQQQVLAGESNWNQAEAMFGKGTGIVKQERGAASVGGGGAPPGLSRTRGISNRLRASRGRSTRVSYNAPRMRAPRLSVSRSRFRRSRPANRLRRRSTIA